ncbi:MAG TPA: choice-of-anchor P family protein, partial [Actinomycetota bacterium]|nr:choice-of-anchor P family protein [Actinomycetota bacterium]
MRRRLSGALILATLASIMAAPQSVPALGTRTTEAVSVWQHRNSGSTTGWDIWWSALGRAGTGPLTWHTNGTPIATALSTLAGDEKNPHVASREAGSIAVWQRSTGTGSSATGWDIYFSTLSNSSGTWTAPAAVSTVAGDDYDPNVAIDPAGNAIAVWVHRNTNGTRQIYWSVKPVSGSWTTAAALPSTGGKASLPEITLTAIQSVSGSTIGRYAVATWSDDIGGGVRRQFASRFTGTAWSTPVQIESAATGIGVSIHTVGFAEYLGTDSDPFGAFGRNGVTADAVGNAYIVWSGGPTILNNYSPAVVGAIWNMNSGAWSPMLAPGGSREVGTGGCENPDAAMTSGAGDFVSVYSFNGYIEDTRRVGGSFTYEQYSYGSSLDDQRPSVAAISDTQVVSVNWGAPQGSGSQIAWSVGTFTGGGNITWTSAATLALSGEDMFPEVASGFIPPLYTGDAYTLDLRVEGTPQNLGIHTLAGARTMDGTAEGLLPKVVLPLGLGEISGAHNTASAGGGSASATSVIERVSLLNGAIQAEAIRTQANASLGPPPSTNSTGTRIGRLVVGGQTIDVPATG